MLDWIERGDVDLVVNTPDRLGRALGRLGDPPGGGGARDPLPDDALGGRLGRARDRRARQAASRRCSACRSSTARARRRRAQRGGVNGPARPSVPAPFGRRRLRGRGRRSARRLQRGARARSRRPAPATRPVRDAGGRRALGRRRRTGGRTCRGPSRSRASRDGEAHFLLEDVGPGTRRLGELLPGEELWLLGPLGSGFRARRARAGAARRRRRRRSRRWCSGRTSSASGPPRPWSASATRDHAAGASAAAGRARRDRRRLGRPPRVGHRAARGRARAGRAATVYACGPPAMLEAVRALCAERDDARELALEAGMACGFGACYGCVVPTREGCYLRVCVDGPVVEPPARARRRVGRCTAVDATAAREPGDDRASAAWSWRTR